MKETDGMLLEFRLSDHVTNSIVTKRKELYIFSETSLKCNINESIMRWCISVAINCSIVKKPVESVFCVYSSLEYLYNWCCLVNIAFKKNRKKNCLITVTWWILILHILYFSLEESNVLTIVECSIAWSFFCVANSNIP